MQFLVITLVLHGTMADLLGNPSGFYQPARPPVTHQSAPGHQGGQYPAQLKSLYQPIPYAYNYAVNDDNTGTNFAQNEQSDGHRTDGSYTVALPDGRIQHVTYSVDPESGYHAEVTYEGEATFGEEGRTAQSPTAPTSELPSAYPGSARARSFKSASERSFPLVFRADARGQPSPYQKELSKTADRSNDFISPFKSRALARLQNRLTSSGLVIFAPKHQPPRVPDISRTVTSPPSHTAAPVFAPSTVYQHQFIPIIPYQSNPTSAGKDRYLANGHELDVALQAAAASGSVRQ